MNYNSYKKVTFLVYLMSAIFLPCIFVPLARLLFPRIIGAFFFHHVHHCSPTLVFLLFTFFPEIFKLNISRRVEKKLSQITLLDLDFDLDRYLEIQR